MKYSKNIQEVIEEENKNWSEIFSKEMKMGSNNFKEFSSYWWQIYYRDIVNYFNKLLSGINEPEILEAGSGSGKASILLSGNISRTFLDISSEALKYADFLAKKFNVKEINYIEGNIFDMPFEDKTFDLVWNIGVVEHYQKEEVKSMIKEMIRLVRSEGFLAIAVPNFNSFPIIKARLLKKYRILKFIPGYRIGTEKKYSANQLIEIINSAIIAQGRYCEYTETKYFGNPLIMETPKWILKYFGSFVEHIFPKRKFLIFIVVKIR